MNKYTAEQVADSAAYLRELPYTHEAKMLDEFAAVLRANKAKKLFPTLPSVEAMQKWANNHGIGDWKIDDIRRAVDDARALT